MITEYNLKDYKIDSQKALENIRKEIINSLAKSRLSIPRAAEVWNVCASYIRGWVNGTNSSNPRMGTLLKLHNKNVINLPSCLNQDEILRKGSSTLSQTKSSKGDIGIKEVILRLGAEVEYNLEKKGLVTRSFHEPLGISPGTITKLIKAKDEEGSNDIHLDTFIKISHSLGVGISSILMNDLKYDNLLPCSSLKSDTLSQNGNLVRSSPERALNHIISKKPWLLKIFKPNQLQITSFERPLKVKYGSDRRVDMSGIDNASKTEVLIESQTTTMDNIHYLQLKSIVKNTDNVQIVWIAPKVVHKYFKKLVSIIKRSNKNMNLFFIEFDSTFLPTLKQLGAMSELDAHKATLQADFKNPVFKVKYQFISMSNDFIGSFKEHSPTGNFQTDNYNLLILKLREKLGCYSSIMSCQYKEGINHIRIAAGLKEMEITIHLPFVKGKGTRIQIHTPDKKSARTSFDEIKPNLFKIQYSADITEVNDTTLCIVNESGNTLESSLDSIVNDIEKILRAFSEYRINLKEQSSN